MRRIAKTKLAVITASVAVILYTVAGIWLVPRLQAWVISENDRLNKKEQKVSTFKDTKRRVCFIVLESTDDSKQLRIDPVGCDKIKGDGVE